MTEVTRAPRKGETIEIEIEEFDPKGKTFGHLDGRVVRVPGGVPGERVAVTVYRRRRGDVEGVIAEVLDPGPHGQEPRCAHAGTCGGCSFQRTVYAEQLRTQHRLLARILAPLFEGGVPAVPIEDVVGCDTPWHYRNKMDFTFGAKRWIEEHEPEGVDGGFAVGLHVPGRFDKVLDVQACHIAFEEATPILADARALARERGISAWDVRKHEGLLRHLVLRKGFATGEIMADLVTTEAAPEILVPYAEALLERHPEITTLVQRVNGGVAVVATGEEVHRPRGEGWIEERVAGLTFRISPDTFFQTNTAQAERMVEMVREEVGLVPGEVVYDLYCGCGLFSLALAQDGSGAVYGFELVEAAVRDAEANALRNGLTPPTFLAGDLAATIAPERLAELGAPPPDVCVVDPPRAGLATEVVEALARLAPRRIVYVSCNPRSAARDLALLLAAGYRLTRIRPLDLFPHTPHLECLFTLERDPTAGAAVGVEGPEG